MSEGSTPMEIAMNGNSHEQRYHFSLSHIIPISPEEVAKAKEALKSKLLMYSLIFY